MVGGDDGGDHGVVQDTTDHRPQTTDSQTTVPGILVSLYSYQRRHCTVIADGGAGNGGALITTSHSLSFPFSPVPVRPGFNTKKSLTDSSNLNSQLSPVS